MVFTIYHGAANPSNLKLFFSLGITASEVKFVNRHDHMLMYLDIFFSNWQIN